MKQTAYDILRNETKRNETKRNKFLRGYSLKKKIFFFFFAWTYHK